MSAISATHSSMRWDEASGPSAGPVPSSGYDSASFVAYLAAQAADILAGERRIAAIVGAPASGKSTLAAELEHRLNERHPGSCAPLPLDGSHCYDEVLVPRG